MTEDEFVYALRHGGDLKNIHTIVPPGFDLNTTRIRKAIIDTMNSVYLTTKGINELFKLGLKPYVSLTSALIRQGYGDFIANNFKTFSQSVNMAHSAIINAATRKLGQQELTKLNVMLVRAGSFDKNLNDVFYIALMDSPIIACELAKRGARLKRNEDGEFDMPSNVSPNSIRRLLTAGLIGEDEAMAYMSMMLENIERKTATLKAIASLARTHGQTAFCGLDSSNVIAACCLLNTAESIKEYVTVERMRQELNSE